MAVAVEPDAGVSTDVQSDVAVSGSDSEQKPAGKCPLDRVLDMLEKTLMSHPQSVRNVPSRLSSRRPNKCRVCDSSEHTTNVHCRMYKLCFKCFSSEHISSNCMSPPHRVRPDCKQTEQIQEN